MICQVSAIQRMLSWVKNKTVQKIRFRKVWTTIRIKWFKITSSSKIINLEGALKSGFKPKKKYKISMINGSSNNSKQKLNDKSIKN